MTGEELRQSILQMTMQGELVEQDYENDEPAWKLLERLNKKVKPIKEEEKPFDIPDNWEWVRLGDIALFENGDRSSKYPVQKDYVDFGVPFLGAKDMIEGIISFQNVRYISPEKFNELGRGKLKDKDIICLLRGYVGKNAIFKVDEKHKTGFICAQMVIIRCLDISMVEYVQAFLKSAYYQNLISHVTTGTAVKQLPANTLSQFLIPVPPLNEQKRIIEKLEELEPFIQQYTELEEKLAKLNQEFPQKLMDSILNEAMQGNLAKQDYVNDEPAWKLIQRIKPINKKVQEPVKEEEKSFDIPDNWEWTRLGRILNKLTDGTHSKPSYVSEGIPFLSVKDMSNGRLSFEGCKFISPKEHSELYKRCNPEFGDVLLTKVGTTGIPVIVDTDKEFSLFVSVALLKLPNDSIFNKYLIEAIKSPVVQTQARENTRGVGNKNWVLRDIANTVLPLPPFNEQQRIVEKIESIKPLIESLKELNA